ncbi:hypothetical protein DFH06DRAFT_1149912 [Mycena polygramma]|nr:hypothetical protein DFH06DRAFT_1149912 [Mycena polygramma]
MNSSETLPRVVNVGVITPVGEVEGNALLLAIVAARLSSDDVGAQGAGEGGLEMETDAGITVAIATGVAEHDEGRSIDGKTVDARNWMTFDLGTEATNLMKARCGAREMTRVAEPLFPIARRVCSRWAGVCRAKREDGGVNDSERFVTNGKRKRNQQPLRTNWKSRSRLPVILPMSGRRRAARGQGGAPAPSGNRAAGEMHRHQPHLGTTQGLSGDRPRVIETTTPVDTSMLGLPVHFAEDAGTSETVESSDFSYLLGDGGAWLGDTMEVVRASRMGLRSPLCRESVKSNL